MWPPMDEVREWFSQSEYDLGSAEAMFDSGRYIYAVYMQFSCAI